MLLHIAKKIFATTLSPTLIYTHTLKNKLWNFSKESKFPIFRCLDKEPSEVVTNNVNQNSVPPQLVLTGKWNVKSIFSQDKFWKLKFLILILKIRERKGKTLTKNWRDPRWKGTCKLIQNISTVTDVFFNLLRIRRLRKTSVTIEIFQKSFCVFACAFPLGISSIFRKNFRFPFPYFMLLVLRYFPLNVVYSIIIMIVFIVIKACKLASQIMFNLLKILKMAHSVS